MRILLFIGFLLLSSNIGAQDFLMIGEDSIEYEIRGSGEPWIVLVSGLMSDVTAWDTIYDSLATHTTTVRFS